VLIILAVRRFRCPDRSCAKATFAEQAEDLSVRYRRRSVPLLGMLAAFGLELGGRNAVDQVTPGLGDGRPPLGGAESRNH
jgi:hypothetical protein